MIHNYQIDIAGLQPVPRPHYCRAGSDDAAIRAFLRARVARKEPVMAGMVTLRVQKYQSPDMFHPAVDRLAPEVWRVEIARFRE